MPRLLRPHIPIQVRYRVALRQLGWDSNAIQKEIDDAKDSTRAPHYRGIGRRLDDALQCIANMLRCEPEELHLDHDPALVNRLKLVRKPTGRTERQVALQPGCTVIRYIPDANDPEYLLYRDKHAHHIKTNVRGDGAQYADSVLAKRERRRVAKQKRAPKFKQAKREIKNRGFPPKGSRPFKRKP